MLTLRLARGGRCRVRWMMMSAAIANGSAT